MSTRSRSTSSSGTSGRSTVATGAETQADDGALLGARVPAVARRHADRAAPRADAARRTTAPQRSLGHGRRRRERPRAHDNAVEEIGAELSPDNAQVLFLADANARFEPYYGSTLFVVPAAGGTPRAPAARLSATRSSSAAWSPDGTVDPRRRRTWACTARSSGSTSPTGARRAAHRRPAFIPPGWSVVPARRPDGLPARRADAASATSGRSRSTRRQRRRGSPASSIARARLRAAAPGEGRRGRAPTASPIEGHPLLSARLPAVAGGTRWSCSCTAARMSRTSSAFGPGVICNYVPC